MTKQKCVANRKKRFSFGFVFFHSVLVAENCIQRSQIRICNCQPGDNGMNCGVGGGGGGTQGAAQTGFLPNKRLLSIAHAEFDIQ